MLPDSDGLASGGPEPTGFDALVARFRQLGKADRHAILASLDPAERARVTAAIARHGAARRDGPRPGLAMARDYAGYSPWLTEIVRHAAIGGADQSGLTDLTRRTITDAHAAMAASGDVAADSLVSQLRRLGARLIDGAGGRRP